jgi:DNA-binding beta-propeller fold protein YncE
VVGAIPGPDGTWDYASIDGVARQLYVAHGDSVLRVELDTGKLSAPLVVGQRLHTIVPLPNGRALVTDSGRNSATIFESATGSVVKAVPTGNGPDAAVLDPASGWVLVMDAKDGDVTLIDPRSGSSPGRIKIGGELEFAAVDGHGTAYVNIDDQAKVAVLDIATLQVVARYPLPGCLEPTGLALDPVTGLLVASCYNGKAIALRARDGRLVAAFAIGKGPDAVIFDAARKMFFIPCEAGTLTILAEGAHGALAAYATVRTAVGARTGALDPKTGRLYLPAAELMSGPPGEHPGSVPGTFRILIVDETRTK